MSNKKLTRVRQAHVDHMIQVLKDFSQSNENPSPMDICRVWNEKFDYEFSNDNKMANQVWKRIVKKFALKFKRSKSCFLSDEELNNAHSLLHGDPNLSFEQLSEELGKQIHWEDLFIGHQEGKRFSANKPSVKRISSILSQDENLCEKVKEMFKNEETIQSITNTISDYVSNSDEETLKEVNADIHLTTTFLYQELRLERRNSRIDKETRQKVFDRLKDLYLNSTEPEKNFAAIINSEFGTKYSADSIPPMMSVWGVLRDIPQENRRRRKLAITSGDLSDNQKEDLENWFINQGNSYDDIVERLKKTHEINVSKACVKNLIKELNLSSNSFEWSKEHDEFLLKEFAITNDSEELTQKFNDKFRLDMGTFPVLQHVSHLQATS